MSLLGQSLQQEKFDMKRQNRVSRSEDVSNILPIAASMEKNAQFSIRAL
jgi:hypothetical protein